jgi:hypothetical protein
LNPSGLIGLIVPRRLRADWRQEWETELRHREHLRSQWKQLDRHHWDILVTYGAPITSTPTGT